MRRLAALGAAVMLVLAFSASVSATATNHVNSIDAGDCFEGSGISGTLDVTVVSDPFVFDVWVTDHIPGESTFVEIPGSRVTLTAHVSDSAFPFGPLDTSQHRDGVNTFRVETSGGTAKSLSISPCVQPEPTPTPTPEATPTPTPEPSPTPTPGPTPTPTPEATPTPTPVPSPTPSPTPPPPPNPTPTPVPTPTPTPTPTPVPTPTPTPSPTPVPTPEATPILPSTDMVDVSSDGGSLVGLAAVAIVALLLSAILIRRRARL